MLPELLLGLVLLGLALVVVFWLLSRRGKPPSDAQSVERMMESFRLSHPSFFVALSCVRKEGLLGEMMEQEDVRGAVEVLAGWGGRKRNPRTDRRGALLTLGPNHENPRTQAALLTVMRTIYLDDRLRPHLPTKVLEDLDRFLDSLTR